MNDLIEGPSKTFREEILVVISDNWFSSWFCRTHKRDTLSPEFIDYYLLSRGRFHWSRITGLFLLIYLISNNFKMRWLFHIYGVRLQLLIFKKFYLSIVTWSSFVFFSSCDLNRFFISTTAENFVWIELTLVLKYSLIDDLYRRHHHNDQDEIDRYYCRGL